MEKVKHLTVACVFWHGQYRAHKYINPGYSTMWVKRLASMVERNLDIPYEFVCLSNTMFDLPGIRVIPLESTMLHGWWAKMELFKPKLPVRDGRILYLDLDMVLLKDMKPFVEFDAPFAICPAFGRPEDREEGELHGYNSSVMAWNKPLDVPIWDVFAVKKRYWMKHYRSDQDFLKEVFPNFATFPEGWIRKLRSCVNNRKEVIPDKKTKIILSMPTKNVDAAREYKLIRKLWK